MRAVVVYESMYGNTHLVAEAIGHGLEADQPADVQVVPVGDADAALLSGADLVVVGGPTHAHGMSRAATRRSAAEVAAKPDSELEMDPDAEGPGLRDWFDSLDGDFDARAAAFDTQIDAPAALTGRASKGIGRKLRHHGFELLEPPESFLVDKAPTLEAGEYDRARSWGVHLAEAMAAASGESHEPVG